MLALLEKQRLSVNFSDVTLPGVAVIYVNAVESDPILLLHMFSLLALLLQ